MHFNCIKFVLECCMDSHCPPTVDPAQADLLYCVDQICVGKLKVKCQENCKNVNFRCNDKRYQESHTYGNCA